MKTVARLAIVILSLALPGLATADPDPSCFARALPADIRGQRLDDVKLLLGWVFDAAAAHRLPNKGDIIDRHSGFAEVPGFAGSTDVRTMAGRYRVMRAPFDARRGYLGMELGALETDGHVATLILANRLFRLPVLLQQPLGVMTDLGTNAAMLGGWRTDAIVDAEGAAAAALADAESLHIPLFTAGQSQAGGEAQLQAAYLITRHPRVITGFITLNAARVTASVDRLGLTSEQVGGINFVKDLDPGFGPHGLLPNHIGLQVYVHRDGSGGTAPGEQSFLSTWRNAKEHTLSAFDAVSLRIALEQSLASPAQCAQGP